MSLTTLPKILPYLVHIITCHMYHKVHQSDDQPANQHVCTAMEKIYHKLIAANFWHMGSSYRTQMQLHFQCVYTVYNVL